MPYRPTNLCPIPSIAHPAPFVWCRWSRTRVLLSNFCLAFSVFPIDLATQVHSKKMFIFLFSVAHSIYKWIAFLPFNRIDNVVIDCKELRLWLGFLWSILLSPLWPAQSRKVVIAYTRLRLVTLPFRENWVGSIFLSHTSSSIILAHLQLPFPLQVLKVPLLSKQKAHLE